MKHGLPQRRPHRPGIHGPRPFQRLAPGRQLLRRPVPPPPQDALRPQPGNTRARGRPVGLGGDFHRLARGGGAQGHRRRRYRRAQRPARPHRHRRRRGGQDRTVREAAGHVRRRGRAHGEGRPPRAQHGLVQLPPRAGRGLRPPPGRGGPHRPRLPLPRHLPPGVGQRPHAAAGLENQQSRGGQRRARRPALPRRRYGPLPQRPAGRGFRA